MALLLLDVVLGMEQDVATEIARSVGRSGDDTDIRIFANAAIGVLRAALRHVFANEDHEDLISTIDIGVALIAPAVRSL